MLYEQPEVPSPPLIPGALNAKVFEPDEIFLTYVLLPSHHDTKV